MTMKKTALIVAALILTVFAGCSAANPVQPENPASPSGGAQEINAWVVKEEAQVADVETGERAGTAYKDFAVTLQEPAEGKVQFSLSWADEKGGEPVTKTYAVDTKYMEKKYIEPRAVIMMISVDMIRLKAGGSFYGENGEKLIAFDKAQGPFNFIQKTDKGYMMTLDMNIVYAKEADVEYIPVSIP
jgi:hypothetical protein